MTPKSTTALDLDVDLEGGVVPISKAASSLAALLKGARSRRQPIIVTQKGYPTGVILDVELYTALRALAEQATVGSASQEEQAEPAAAPAELEAAPAAIPVLVVTLTPLAQAASLKPVHCQVRQGRSMLSVVTDSPLALGVAWA